MKIKNLKKTPKSYYGAEEETDLLSEWDISRLKEQGITEAYYWYKNHGYEDSGQIIYKLGEKWGYHNMGHCSCYGPIDSSLTVEYESPEAILEKATDDFKAEVSPLVKLATTKRTKSK